MPLFSIYCVDKPGHAQVRADNRPAHLDYARQFKEQFLLGGPMLSEDGAGMVGSLLIIDLPDLAAARAWAENDPYAKAGLFESVQVRPFKKVIPDAL